jgi:hypothetical protein
VISPRLEEVAPAVPLQVFRIPDLEPRRTRAALIRAASPLRDDALEIVFAGDTEQVDSAMLDMPDVADARFDARHNGREASLAFMQRPYTQIFAIESQQIEGEEVRPFTTEQQRVELAAAIGRQTADLPVEDCVLTPNGVHELVAENRSLGRLPPP